MRFIQRVIDAIEKWHAGVARAHADRFRVCNDTRCETVVDLHSREVRVNFGCCSIECAERLRSSLPVEYLLRGGRGGS